jgi:alpha-tubulin suppressor-like RCC1 family protein
MEEDKLTGTELKTNKTKVFSWGNGKGGNLGNGSEDYEALPYNVKQLNGKNIVKIQCGEWFWMAVSQNGTLYGWGKSSRSRFGMSSPNDIIFVPTKIPLKVKVQTFACGYWHSVIVSTEGVAYAVGDNKKGAWGLGHNENTSEFTKIPDFEDVSKVAAGCSFTLFVNSEGNLFSWGGKGLAGHPKNKGDILSPKLVKGIEEPVTHIDCGVDHAAVVTESGKLYTWGSNAFNQLGHGSAVSKSTIQHTPKLVSSLQEVKVVNASCSKGLKHCQTAWVDSEGIAYFWGWGYKGKLGNTEEWTHAGDWDETEPKILNIDVPIAIAESGGIHSSVIDTQGILYTFGCGSHGRLGHPRYIEGKYRHLYKESQPKKVEFFEGVGKVVDYSSTYSSNVALIEIE